MASKKNKIKATQVGISVSAHSIEAVSLSKKDFRVEKAVAIAMPPGILSHGGDRVENPQELGRLLSEVARQLGAKTNLVHLSIPGTLLRFVEMPKIGSQELYLSLSSEAERYVSFDDTEAAVNFDILDEAGNMQRVIFGAVRKDTLAGYHQACQAAKLKIASIDLEPLNIFRGLVGLGILDSLVQQIGPDAYWGTFFVEPERLRLSLWQGNKLVELREVQMNTQAMRTATPDPVVIGDIIDEINRTVKTIDPTVWLTFNLPQSVSAELSEKLGTPFEPCGLPPELGLGDLGLTPVGAAMRSTIAFPFDFNMAAVSLGPAGADGGAGGEGGGNMAGTFAFAASIVLAVLGVLVFGGMKIFELTYLDGKINELQTENNGKLAQVEQLKVEVQRLNEEAALGNTIAGIINQAITRNSLYVQLSRDLRQKTPTNLWLDKAMVDDSILLSGKALTHQSVINFARSFDGAPYSTASSIDSIEKQYVGKTVVYNFNLHLDPFLNPSLIEMTDAMQEVDKAPQKETKNQGKDKEAAKPPVKKGGQPAHGPQ